MTKTYDVARCWAYGPTGQRCEQDAAHPGNHTVSTEWTDDECVTPEHFTMAKIVGETRSARPVPIIEISDAIDADEPGLDRCASCGWPEDGHESNPHGCRSFA